MFGVPAASQHCGCPSHLVRMPGLQIPSDIDAGSTGTGITTALARQMRAARIQLQSRAEPALPQLRGGEDSESRSRTRTGKPHWTWVVVLATSVV
jgi:hypothetical protein